MIPHCNFQFASIQASSEPISNASKKFKSRRKARVHLQPYSYNELEQATNRFQEESGRGCFSAVYKELYVKVIRLLQLSN